MALQERIPNRGRRGGARDTNRKFVARYDAMRVETVRGVRYLGVHIDEKLKFAEHYRNVATRVVREFAKLERVSGAYKGWTSSVMKKMYSMVVEPILLYGSEVWGQSMTRNEKIREKWRGVQLRL